MRILILGASYGSLLSTKLLMAGHDVTLVCRTETARLINEAGTIVRLKLRGEAEPRTLRSGDFPGRVDACTPPQADPAKYDMVVLAMQEPQYAAHELRALLARIGAARVPCMSIMNMPPLAYLRRISSIDAEALRNCYLDSTVWDLLEPGLVTLCSPDPQAFRPPNEAANVLQVGLPTNFKVAAFENPTHTAMLRQLEADIAAVTLDGLDVPVKLRVHDSLFVPFAKWSMLMTGNFRCVEIDGARPICAAVHSDLKRSREVYEWVDALVRDLGADAGDAVPFEKYAKAAQHLLKPSSAARAIEAGAPDVERVDRLVQALAAARGLRHPEVDATVATVDARLHTNRGARAA